MKLDDGKMKQLVCEKKILRQAGEAPKMQEEESDKRLGPTCVPTRES